MVTVELDSKNVNPDVEYSISATRALEVLQTSLSPLRQPKGKTIQQALMMTANTQLGGTYTSGEEALNALVEEWDMNQSETIREALRRAASEVSHE